MGYGLRINLAAEWFKKYKNCSIRNLFYVLKHIFCIFSWQIERFFVILHPVFKFNSEISIYI